MLRGFFKLYLLNKLFGGRGGRMGGRRGMGCGCLGIVLVVILLFFLLRGCDGGMTTGEYGF
jgi:hypothetical protein